MKRLLTYGLLLLTILAGHFVVSACQDDLPETTEVMMTFTTRAVVTQNNESDAINIEKMNDLRVIVVRENGDIVYNDTRQVGGASTATVSFQTPVKTGGENFKFFAIANYSSLVNAPDWANVNIDDLITYVEGDGSEISIEKPIPQTKYWEYPVKQLLNETQSITKQLDFVASKISVQFINTYDAAQTLSNIHITGITPNGKGRLFNLPTGVKDANEEEIYEEVYVTTNDVTLADGKIDFETITVNAAIIEETPTASAIKHYYTYPVDNGNISSPTLHATWNNKTYELPLEGITELKRNDHLKIIVTLTGHALTINYSIAPWVEEPTNIGSPTTNGGYQVDGWGNGNDIIIGGEDESGGGDDPVVSGDELVIFESETGERKNNNTRIILCENTFVNNEDNVDYFVANNLLCIDLYYHATKSTVSVTDAWGGTDIISEISYQFDEEGRKNIQIEFSESDIAILKEKGMAILPSADDGGFTLYKVSIKKVQ